MSARRVVSTALRFRFLVGGLALALIVAGALALANSPTDVLPEFAAAPVLQVQTEAPGLSGPEVEQLVTVPMENNLLDGILGVWDVRSTSVAGLSTVSLYFEPGTQTLRDRELVQERLAQAFALPNVTKPPLLIQPLSSTSRVMMIGLSSSTLNPLDLSYLARWIVKPKLSGVPGVADVAIFGQQDRQLQVQVNPSRLASHGVTLQQLINATGNAQLVSPLSYLEGSFPGSGGFLEGNNQRLDIRPVLPLGEPANLAAVPIAGAPGTPTIGDVATVVEGSQPPIGAGVVGGGPGLVLAVEKLPGASAGAVTDGVQEALDDLVPALHGVQVNTHVFRAGTYLKTAQHNFATALVIAALLGVIALLMVLLDVRAMAVAAVAAATSVMAALLALYLLGYSINSLSILGLAMASAVVADDAVPAVRAALARLRGRPPDADAAVLEACAPLRVPLGYAALIALVALAPVFFARGVNAQFVRPMLIAYALVVLASMLAALFVTPALLALLFRWPPRERGANHPRERATRALRNLVHRSLGQPTPVLLGVCALGAVLAICVVAAGSPHRPRYVDRTLVVDWRGPPGMALGELDRVTTRVAQELERLPQVSDVAATAGRAVSADQIVDVNSGQLWVTIRPGADYSGAVNAVRAIALGTPGMQAQVGTYEDASMSGLFEKTPQDVVVRVYGQDYPTLGGIAAQVRRAALAVPGVSSASYELPKQQAAVAVTVNVPAALRAGIVPGDARRQASTLVYGLTVGNFFQDQAVFDVTVVGEPAVRADIDDVRRLPIDAPGGRQVRLGTIASVKLAGVPQDIEHEALSRYVDVTVHAGGASTSTVAQQLRERIAKLSYPLDYHAEVVGAAPTAPTSRGMLFTYLLAAAIGIFLLLQAAFGSWRLAAVLFCAAPAAAAGAALVALIGGYWHSLAAYAAIFTTCLLALRHGLVAVYSGGGGGEEPAAPAAHSVASNVVIAAVALPFALMGDVAGGELLHVAAIALLGGLVTLSLFDVLFLPAMSVRFGTVAVVEEEPAVERVAAPVPG
jgi:multidrug efflux pump subunit AcrB